MPNPVAGILFYALLLVRVAWPATAAERSDDGGGAARHLPGPRGARNEQGAPAIALGEDATGTAARGTRGTARARRAVRG
jgi:hypothetical protein